VKVRAFRAQDAREIIRIHSISNIWFEEGEITQEFVLNAANRNDFRFFVAEEEARVIGFCGVLYYDAVGRAELGPIAVDSSVEKNGVGSKLVEYTLSFLREKNTHRVIARVKEENNRAKEFFTKQGFTQEARLEHFTRAGENVIQYMRLLK